MFRREKIVCILLMFCRFYCLIIYCIRLGYYSFIFPLSGLPVLLSTQCELLFNYSVVNGLFFFIYLGQWFFNICFNNDEPSQLTAQYNFILVEPNCCELLHSFCWVLVCIQKMLVAETKVFRDLVSISIIWFWYWLWCEYLCLWTKYVVYVSQTSIFYVCRTLFF